ncbi:MAG: hypothetical protein KC431_26060, partial [Myxococcales bacterium]|nr:hypothetical protein [Myxococcales bacterium]
MRDAQAGPGGKSRWLPVWVGALLLVAMGLFVGLRFEQTSEITHFLAAGEDARLARLSRQLAESELTKTTILVVDATREGEGEPPEAARAAVLAAADGLAETLSSDPEVAPEVAWVRSRWQEQSNEAVHDLYFPRRFYFTDDDGERRAARLEAAGLEAAAEELQRQLRLPTAAMVKQLAPADPLLLYPAMLKRLEQAQAGPLELMDGHFATAEGDAVIFLASQ